jgi:PAS domain S-box-containing protein/putative nucleotidyltransferase with HDIG domain
VSHIHAKILIVDDSATARETLGALLYSPDYDLYFASNGLEALEKAVEVIPDLILLDVMMPDMNGYEVCENLRQDEVLAEVPVIMVTALDDRKSRLQGIRAGADDFISKPFDTAELGARVQMIVRLNRYRRLHAERRRFEQIIQFSPDGIVIIDEEGIIQLANQTFLKFLHAEDESLVVGHPLESFLIGNNPGSFLEIISQVVSGLEQNVQAETVLKSFDETSLAVELVMGRFEWGERSMAQVNIHDLTVRNLAEEAKRESERRYRNIFDGAPVAIFEEDFYEIYLAFQELKAEEIPDMEAYLDQHADFVKQMAAAVEIHQVNAYGKKIFHIDQGNARFNDLNEIFIQESYQGFKKVLLAIANGEEHCEVENIQQTLDGERLNVLVSTSFPKEPEQFHHVLVSVVDITDLKKTESALRESEARYHKMLQMANDAIFVTDTDTFQLVDVNEKAQNLVGVERADLLSMKIFDLYPVEDQEKCTKFYYQALLDSLNSAEICQIKHANGHLIDVEITNSRIELGNKTLLMGIFRDITERRKQERVREALLTVSIELRKTETYTEALSVMLQQLLIILNADKSVVARSAGKYIELYSSDQDELQLHEAIWTPENGEPYWTELQPFAFYNALEDRPQLPWLEGIPSEAAILEAPLFTHNEVIGSIWVGRGSAWEDQDGQILASVADLAANAIQRMDFLDELERRLAYLQALFTMDRAIAGRVDIELIFEVLLQLVNDQLGVGAANVLLYDEQDQSLEFAGGIGFRLYACRPRYSREQLKLSGQVLSTGQLVKILDLRKEINTLPDFLSPEILLDQEGFQTFYGIPLKEKGRILGILEIFHRERVEYDDTAMDFLLALADQAAIAIAQAKLFEDMSEANQALIVAYDETIEGWALALEMRDNETQGHSWRVTELVVELAKRMGVSGLDLDHLRRGAILHDIGKMGVPDRILHKPGKLDPEEWEIMKKHPEYGHEMLSNIDFLQDALDIPLYHHERWDGKGYPNGLKGNAIPLAARIFAIIDVWDAVTNDRPYHAAWSHEEALAYIYDQNGKHFDPDVVKNFLDILDIEEVEV